ncbi:MAG: hypothetical protein KGI60_00440 [Patescibacteria group bacterium]|nr:hypothetical protein [Patescibacteria group bacterium]
MNRKERKSYVELTRYLILIAATVAFAVATYPLLYYSGALKLMNDISVALTISLRNLIEHQNPTITVPYPKQPRR